MHDMSGVKEEQVTYDRHLITTLSRPYALKLVLLS
jgi:hypothetical protein